jgi:hypothetical protein
MSLMSMNAGVQTGKRRPSGIEVTASMAIVARIGIVPTTGTAVATIAKTLNSPDVVTRNGPEIIGRDQTGKEGMDSLEAAVWNGIEIMAAVLTGAEISMGVAAPSGIETTGSMVVGTIT